MTLSFLPFFNLKERHYIIPPIDACNPFQYLTSSTTAGVGEKLELVVTPFSKINFAGTFKEELELCCSSKLNLLTTHFQGGFPYSFKVFTFSIRDFQAIITLFPQQPLSILNNLPSVLHKTQGRRAD